MRFDTLTGFTQRALFMDRLGNLGNRAYEHFEDYLFAVLFLDLDKVINDNMDIYWDQLLDLRCWQANWHACAWIRLHGRETSSRSCF